MGPPRSYSSGCQKRKKKQRIEQLVESQRGAMDKFFTSNNQTGLFEHIDTIESIENKVNQEEENKDMGTKEGNRNENDQNISNENEDECGM